MEKSKQKKYLSVGVFLLLTFTFVVAALFNFEVHIQGREYEMQLEALKEFSDQGSLSIETKLGGYVNTLNGLAGFLQEGALDLETNRKYLQDTAGREEMDFQYIGVADLSGKAWITNGSNSDISDRDFFQEALNQKYVITESKESEFADAEIFIVAVPVPDKNGQPRGVLYGVIETDSFRLYENTSLDLASQYLQVIDRKGAYIMRENIERSIVKDKNLFDGLRVVESKIPADEVISRIQKGEPIITEVSDGKREYLIYFSPLQMNDWYVVTVMNKADITKRVSRLLGNDVYLLMAEVVGAVALLCVLIVWFSIKEKKQSLRVYEQMKMDEEIFRIASAESASIIMVYNIKEKQLKIMNHERSRIRLPAVLENAPKNLPVYLADTENVSEQLEKIFAAMEKMNGTEEFLLSLKVEKELHKFRLKLRSWANEKQEVMQCVCVMQDVTEEIQLRQNADIDFLTGLDNRRSGTRKIESFLEDAVVLESGTHAIVIMDLDNFKKLNDTLGHQTGDKALQDVARVLRRHFRDYDIICRLAGDEFIVLMKNIPADVIGMNIQALLKKLVLTYGEGEKSVTITASAGIVVTPVNGIKFKALYDKADKALYQVKREKKNSFRFYEEEMA
ncbi:sensor domain-containing diguanylate cyclase [Lachnospiraceae bacterium 62-35]